MNLCKFAEVASVDGSDNCYRDADLSEVINCPKDSIKQSRTVPDKVMVRRESVYAYADRGDPGIPNPGDVFGVEQKSITENPCGDAQLLQMLRYLHPMGGHQGFAASEIHLLDKKVRKLVAQVNSFRAGKFALPRLFG